MDRLTSMSAFVKVVDSGGFAAAARRLNMSTTMVSSHVRSLEDRLGVRLLNRTTRKVSLTDVGKVYYERCTRILDDLDEADALADSLQSNPIGTLRLYVRTAHIVRFVAPVVSEFLAVYPKASVDLMTGERSADLVEEGFDLAIRLSPPKESSLIVRTLAPWRHVLCAAPSYLERHGAPKDLSDLEEHDCIRHALYPHGNHWHFLNSKQASVSVRVSGRLISNNGETLLTAALRGLGILHEPEFLIADELASGRLVRILPAYTPVEYSMSAVYPHRHRLSAKVRLFVDLLVSYVAERRSVLRPKVP